MKHRIMQKLAHVLYAVWFLIQNFDSFVQIKLTLAYNSALIWSTKGDSERET